MDKFEEHDKSLGVKQKIMGILAPDSYKLARKLADLNMRIKQMCRDMVAGVRVDDNYFYTTQKQPEEGIPSGAAIARVFVTFDREEDQRKCLAAMSVGQIKSMGELVPNDFTREPMCACVCPTFP